MKGSYTVYFTEAPSVMNHSDTQELNGQLKLLTGKAYGVTYAKPITTDFDVTTVELRKYENYDTQNDSYYVSNNGGSTWKEYTQGEPYTFGTVGSSLTFKIIMVGTSGSGPNPAYESICLLYK